MNLNLMTEDTCRTIKISPYIKSKMIKNKFIKSNELKKKKKIATTQNKKINK